MTITECYTALGGSYEEVFSRFRTEERVQKFMFKFLQDQSFQSLQDAMEQGNMEDAFRAAHTLKGVSQNLGFTSLSNSSSAITEMLRANDFERAAALLSQVHEDYIRTVSAIKEFQEAIL